jgi:hypothetical protein
LKMINHPSQNLDLGGNLTTHVNFSNLKHKLKIWTVWFLSNDCSDYVVLSQQWIWIQVAFHISNKWKINHVLLLLAQY